MTTPNAPPVAPPAPPAPVEPNVVQRQLTSQQTPDPLRDALKFKDDALDALKAANQQNQDTIRQQSEMLTQQNQNIAQLQEGLRSANEQLMGTIPGLDTPPAVEKKPAQAPQAGAITIEQIQQVVQGVVAQSIQPFASTVVGMKGQHDRTVFERQNEIRLKDEQHAAIQKAQEVYPNMPYHQAVNLLPQELAIQPNQKVQQAIPQVPAVSNPQDPPQPVPELNIHREPRMPSLAPPATPPTGQPPASPKKEENAFTLGQMGEAMKNATAKGNKVDRDKIAARGMVALIEKDGQPVFPEVRAK